MDRSNRRRRRRGRASSDNGQDKFVDESNRTPILVLLSGVLWLGFGTDAAGAQDSRAERFVLESARQAPPAEPRDARVEILGGVAVLRTDTTLPMRQVGVNVWMTRHWGLGISHQSWTGYPTGGATALFSIRYRLKLYDGRTELHVGAGPVALSKYRAGFEFEKTAFFDFSVGRRLHRGFGVRFGLGVAGEGGAFPRAWRSGPSTETPAGRLVDGEGRGLEMGGEKP